MWKLHRTCLSPVYKNIQRQGIIDSLFPCWYQCFFNNFFLLRVLCSCSLLAEFRRSKATLVKWVWWWLRVESPHLLGLYAVIKVLWFLQALLNFEDSIDSQSEWHQFHHLCYWELMWCHRWVYHPPLHSLLTVGNHVVPPTLFSFRCDWLLAMKYAERLCKESRWSRATYTYQKASFLMLCDDQTENTKAHIEYLMR